MNATERKKLMRPAQCVIAAGVMLMAGTLAYESVLAALYYLATVIIVWGIISLTYRASIR